VSAGQQAARGTSRTSFVRSTFSELTGWRLRLPARSRDPWFWAIQLGIVAFVALHAAFEASAWMHRSEAFGSLVHMPLVLLLVPVVAAGFRYGVEGALFSSLWAVILSIPVAFLWHNDGSEWIGEMVFLGVVLCLGMVVGVPIDRERRQRALAEAATAGAERNARHVSLLHEVTSALVRTADVEEVVRTVLRQLADALSLRAAAVVVTREDGADGELLVGGGADPGAVDLLQAWVERPEGDPGVRTGDPGARAGDPGVRAGDPVQVFPFSDTPRRRGALLVVVTSPPLTADEHDLLDAASGQITIALDNAELQRQERASLQRYASAVTRGQEEERRHIARELHDVATHELLMLCRDLDELADLTAERPMAAQLEELRDQAGDVVGYLRRFTGSLRPSVLDHLGLVAALEWLGSLVQERAPFEVSVVTQGTPRRLPLDHELAVYRIVEEALRNVERHAEAAQVAVLVVYTPDRLRIEVRDDGRGFVSSARLPQPTDGGFGLVGMHERAHLIGGEVTVESTPGAGTSLRIELATSPCSGPA
jgi:signal transduction histidine kinase